MRIIITGASGLIGSRLVDALLADGHDLTVFTRPGSERVAVGRAGVEHAVWDPGAGVIDQDAVEGRDAVIHLAGVGIADSRWSARQKERILRSRTDGTGLLARTIRDASTPPPVLLSASAIGYYGDHGDRIIDETASAGDDFTARVCIEWEGAAQPAIDGGTRVTFLRTGIVQAPEGGPLAKQLPFFKLGLGGRVGSGRQYVSWISIVDEIRAIQFLLDHDIAGPVNLTAPEPVTNSTYTRALGRAVHRPTTILPITGPRLLYGRELADTLLLTSTRVVPAALVEAGFEFRFPELDGALADLLG
ncbi:MAG: TIGR01777 family oxidoreductase [Microthrixaceae bacterium]